MNQFQTLKSDLTQSRIVDINSTVIDDDEIIVKIESYAFTANNVTYGVAGDTIGYWKFFQQGMTKKNEWGCIPVWGFAEITDSNVEGLNIGERLFGYFPAANSLTLKPTKISYQSFTDGKEHRKELPPVYNTYIRLDGDQNYDASMDAIRALLFPLHITAFCLCDALAEDAYFGASQIIIISASSKTAIGLAQGLADMDNSPKIVGLTSSRNTKFIESLGCYDQVISYDELKNIDYSAGSIMVDMAGNREILGKLHGELGGKMIKCLTVGMTHWDNGTTAEDALGQAMQRERTEFFSLQRTFKSELETGDMMFMQKTNSFMAARALQSKTWMQIKEIHGLENFTSTYKEMVDGKINPSEGIIVNLTE